MSGPGVNPDLRTKDQSLKTEKQMLFDSRIVANALIEPLSRIQLPLWRLCSRNHKFEATSPDLQVLAGEF